MTSSPLFVHKIHEDRLCKLLEVNPKGLAKLMRRRGLPAPVDSDEHGPFWSITTVRDWITATGYRPLQSLLLDWWPDPDRPADYWGAEPVRYRRTDPAPAAVLQHWHTSGAGVVVCWPMPGHVHLGRYLRDWAPDAHAYLTIGIGWGIYGPDVWARRGNQTSGDGEDIEWADLARVLGQPAPFWPYQLRHPDLIATWKPRDPPVRHHGVPGVDIDPLLHMAVLYPVDHLVHKTMIYYAQVIQSKSDATDSLDVRLLKKHFEEGLLTPQQLTVAAVPVPAPDVQPEELPEVTRRSGWREVLPRDDWLAEQCVNKLYEWNSGGGDLSHPHIIEISRTPSGQEFLSRLERSPRRAMFAILDPDHEATPMVDPLTDTPVAVPTDQGERIRALAPNRLPTLSPLAELILEDPIWIRTDDDRLYPAPYHSYYGLSWGYGGTGPATLAALIVKLLDDITAYGADPSANTQAPEGLLQLVQHDWPTGTALTRAQLVAARDGHPDKPS